MNTKSFKYLSVQPTDRRHYSSGTNYNPLGSDRPYQSLGDKIRIMLDTGQDLGEKINPLYDPEDSNDINILASMRHDAMDIAEEFGRMPEVASAPLPQNNDDIVE